MAARGLWQPRAMHRPLLLAATLLADPAAMAQDAMTAAEFEAYVEGRTMTYGTGGAPYGAEEYRPGRRVRWSVFDGECLEGVWYPKSEDICFRYDALEGEKCWRFTLTPQGLAAEFTSDPDDFTVYEVERSDEPLECPGPKVGV